MNYRLVSKAKIFILVLLNMFIVSLTISLCYIFARDMSKEELETEKTAFCSAVSSAEKTAFGYLENQQEICNDWAKYINNHNLSMAEAINYLRESNSNSQIMVHIIDPVSKRGFSSCSNALGQNNISYEECFPDISKMNVNDSKTDVYSNDVTITNMYINPVNSVNVVGFVKKVNIYENNSSSEYLLLRVVPVSLLKSKWLFPEEYDEAELSLIIKSNGDFIIRSNSMRTDNFWEHLKLTNKLSDFETDQLSKQLIKNGNLIHGKNAYGENAYYVCSSETKGDWAFIGYIPEDGMEVVGIKWASIISLIAGFIVMFVADGTYILRINRRLRKSNEVAREANQAKTRFLSSMSHDIRTPMNAIVGMTTIAEKHADSPEQVKESLGKIRLASNHLLTLINDILDISKVESGKMNLSPTYFSLKDSVINMQNLVKQQVHDKDITMNIYLKNVMHEILFADELRLNQIFINLLSNAVKYTPEGGSVSIEIEEEPIPEEIDIIDLTYRVRDTGIGMDEEFMKTMYDSFTRAVDNRISKTTGSGLGLAITKQMTDLMNGTISCKSKLGEGTEFTVKLRLPVKDGDSGEFVLPKNRTLLVDSDELFLETAKETLESLSLSVDTATNGSDAIKMFSRAVEEGKEYQLIIVRRKLPKTSGRETVKKIRSLPGGDRPKILISSFDPPKSEEYILAAGANGYVTKPFFRSYLYYRLGEKLGVENQEILEEEDPAEIYGGLRLLVAEDNDLNWEIIEELLGFFDISAVRAENGQRAVQLVEASEQDFFDAVLMDVQMPVMNGKEAARSIRKLTDTGKSSIPIIAMTADAFAEDVRECLESGMNGHVPKPVEMAKIFEELRKNNVRGNKNI